eukprot:5034637-Prymnesium_polylepis.2
MVLDRWEAYSRGCGVRVQGSGWGLGKRRYLDRRGVLDAGVASVEALHLPLGTLDLGKVVELEPKLGLREGRRVE